MGHESHSENNYGKEIKWNKISQSDDVVGKETETRVIGPESEDKSGTRTNQFVFPSDSKKDNHTGSVGNVV